MDQRRDDDGDADKNEATSTAAPSKIGDTRKEQDEPAAVEQTAEENEEEEEEVEPLELEEDVYSLMFIENNFSMIGWYCNVTSFMQFAIIFLFLVGVKSNNTPQNVLNVPPAADQNVRIAQFLALPLCVMCHEDCTTALYLLAFKWKAEIQRQHPHATKLSWYMSLTTRFVMGFLLVFMSFIQIMQATNITDLFLNLEAIVFVGNIDNFAFWLAKWGFMKDEFQVACKKIESVRLPPTKGLKRNLTRKLLMLLTYLILMFGWIVISVRQRKGRYLADGACSSFTVRFGDNTLLLTEPYNINANGTARGYFTEGNILNHLNGTSNMVLVYSYFSGTYRVGNDPYKGRGNNEWFSDFPEIHNGQLVYYETIPNFEVVLQDRALGKFQYCSGDDGYPGAWIFTVVVLQDAFTRDDTNEDCGKWLMRSPPTEAVNLEEVPTEGWKVWTGETVEDAIDFSMVCSQCKVKADCNYNGKCNVDKGICECNAKDLGGNCEDGIPCHKIDLVVVGDSSLNFYPLMGFRLLHFDLRLGPYKHRDELLLVYGRPVYVLVDSPVREISKLLNQTDETFVTFIFYSGNRWIVTAWEINGFQAVFIPQFSSLEVGEYDDDAVDDDDAYDDDAYDDDAFYNPYGDTTWPGFHSFWDGLVTSDFVYYSEPTSSGTPLASLTWYEPLESQSVGDFGLYGASQEIKLEIHCSDCESNNLDLCGLKGACGETGLCQCGDCYGGYYCEYSPDDLYTQEQVNLYDYYLEFGIGEDYSTLYLSNPEQCTISDTPSRVLKDKPQKDVLKNPKLSTTKPNRALREKLKTSSGRNLKKNRRRSLHRKSKWWSQDEVTAYRDQ